MKFEENKVVSAFNMHDVQLKDLGWFGNTRKELKMKVETEKPLQLIARDFTLAHIFQSEEGGRSIFFYPAPYEYLQAQWVEKNNVKVGDTFRVIRGWSQEEFGWTQGATPLGENVLIEGIYEDFIGVQSSSKECWGVPYFVLEKVNVLIEPQYELKVKYNPPTNEDIGEVQHRYGKMLLSISEDRTLIDRIGTLTYGEIFDSREFERLLEYIWNNRYKIEEDM